MTTHKDSGDKVGLKLALRDWLYILSLLAAMVAYFVRIEVQVRDIASLKAKVESHGERIAKLEAQRTRNYGPTRGDRDR